MNSRFFNELYLNEDLNIVKKSSQIKIYEEFQWYKNMKGTIVEDYLPKIFGLNYKNGNYFLEMEHIEGVVFSEYYLSGNLTFFEYLQIFENILEIIEKTSYVPKCIINSKNKKKFSSKNILIRQKIG